MMAERHALRVFFMLYVSPCEINILFAVKHDDAVREERSGSEWRSGNDCAGTPERLEEEEHQEIENSESHETGPEHAQVIFHPKMRKFDFA